jgi:hypothetical protein
MPLPGEPDASMEALQQNGPELAPAFGGLPQPMPQANYPVDQYGRAIPPQPGVAANFLSPIPDPRSAGANDRRSRRPPQPGPNGQTAKSQRDEDGNDAGLLGFRGRRLDRQRAAAARAR